jgi:hypothetical protein
LTLIDFILQNKETWEPQVTAGGHFDVVSDIQWDKGEGHYLVSLSIDQTTRLHGPLKRPNKQVLDTIYF